MEQTEKNVIAIIMAGGAGTRFWPLSTDTNPKQFLNLFDDRSLLQKSFDRISGLIPHHRVLILTSETFVPLVRQQLPHVPVENIIGEPVWRDTAGAVALGAVLCRKRFGNPVIITLSADHMIEPIESFDRSLLSAARFARTSGALYTFGIQPSYPATAYGYLELGLKVADDDGNAYRGGIAILDAADNMVFCDDPEEQVMLIGIKDLVIVRTGKRTLIVHKDRTQDIKELLRKRQDLK